MNVLARLELIFDWYARMISPETGRLVYVYDPVDERVVLDGSPIRDIATVWDVELLARFLRRHELDALAARSLRHHLRGLAKEDGTLRFDEGAIGEPSSIAHSAFLILGLLLSDHERRDELVAGLVAGVLRQQRPDGSLKIFFGDEPDDGADLYPGEAMLALMESFRAHPRGEVLAAVERAFAWEEARHGRGAQIDDDALVFFANWQSGAIALLAAESARRGRDDLAARARRYVLGLHDRILAGGFYDDVARHPHLQATVEVACALEGVNDAYALAAESHDVERQAAYAEAIRKALAFLLRAQRLDGGTARERGGFGHSLSDRTQRIDVTGHVVSGFIKSVSNGIA